MEKQNLYFDKFAMIPEKVKFLIFLGYGLISIAFGLIMDTPQEVLSGLFRIITEPDLLISDYIGVGGLGASFVNSGLLTVICILLLYWLKTPVNGIAIASIFLIAGFAFLGKNIFNVWIIILGVYAYARYQGDSFKEYIYVALLSTSLSPLATYFIFTLDQSLIIRIIAGLFVGFGIGFIMPPFASYLLRVHQGFNLYNVGFTAGVFGTVFVSVMRSYGFEIGTRFIWSTGNNFVLSLYLLFVFSSMIIIGFFLNKRSFKGLLAIYDYAGRLISDFIIMEGFAPSLINMGINGLAATAYVLLVKGQLNGASLAGILTIAGFGAFGKHLKNIVPIFVGVILGGLTKMWAINDPAAVLAGLFGTTLAPIGGKFGWRYGILAGFIHSSVVLNVGYLHGGFNLYNNGFAGGIVAATLIPIIEHFREEG